jgi:amidophosphoribosyltransferase
MARMSEFCAFRAAIQLLKDRNMQYVIDDVYTKCKTQEHLPKEKIVNYVTEIYSPFTQKEVSDKIASMLANGSIGCEVELVYQTIVGLDKACPNHKGKWYFTGEYPTPGGNRLVNKAFINYYEGKEMYW